jgi:hypothetical protein
MKTLLNANDRDELRSRLSNVRPDSQHRWGRMSAQQMICHLSDSFRSALGERYASPDTSLFKRIVLKRLALWVPVPWPHGFKTRPENDQLQGGTRPGEFAIDLRQFLVLFERFCSVEDEFGPHPIFGQMSRIERMRWGYLHMDHHLRQFGV